MLNLSLEAVGNFGWFVCITVGRVIELRNERFLPDDHGLVAIIIPFTHPGYQS